MADSEEGGVYFVVNNIPPSFRSADLRNYFSQFIESGGFLCFHYRHRPEVRINPAEFEEPKQRDGTQKQTQSRESDRSARPASEDEPSTESKARQGDRKAGSCCCVVLVRSSDAERFVKMYSGNQWIDSKGNWLMKRCALRRIKVSEHSDPDVFPYRTKVELRRHGTHSDRFTKADLKALPELNPPALMPVGNVGTPVCVFLQLIQSCRLPPRLIRKLGLTFPKTGSHRRYGNVPYQYHNSSLVAGSEESVFTAGGAEISGPGSVPPLRTTTTPKTQLSNEHPVREQTAEDESEDDQSGPDDDDDRCEEWERHEALHEDVTSQERTKERLYEEEIELKWEKGGSGLVFYTDAQYWQEEEEGDFDEQTADDWDVDMSVYYDKDGGDMDSRDYVRMRYEKRLREGLEETSSQKIGTFEKFTKGVGRRVMEKQGWRDGDGLGHARSGMPEALENEGQNPNCKRGFGYHGEKLSSFLPLKRPRPDFHISTIYDQPKDIDQGDSLLRRQPSTSMKHTDWRPGRSTEPSS
ncbi:G patch domain-containing protein 3 [Pygocentrus nattereri]|uniref:G-patch domain-containing protein n=1 Tax=Pygocentrus nattereri TaxID=42514 RepID=A0A3B4E3Q6_PYGNA|nr:G patch domain-containing protein 3 [Pygocentrus nattereri]